MGVIQNSLCEQCHLIGFAPEYLFPGTLVLNRKIGPLRKLPGYSHTKTTSKVGCTSIAGRFRQWSGRCNSHVVVLGLSLKASSGNRKCGSRTAFANAERQLHSQNLIWLYLDLGVSGKRETNKLLAKQWGWLTDHEWRVWWWAARQWSLPPCAGLSSTSAGCGLLILHV